MVGNVASGKNAWYRGLRGVAVAAAVDFDVAVVKLKLFGKEGGIRAVANGDENAINSKRFAFAVFIADGCAINACLVTADFFQFGV